MLPPNEELIEIKKEDYLKLVSARVVLNVLEKSINQLRNVTASNNQNNSNSNNDVKLESANSNIEQTQSNDVYEKSENDLDLRKSNEYVNKRKYFDIKRWNCISRPQYKYSCGISSLVSCWNYLYSKLGHGSHEPLTQENAMKILGFTEPFDDIRFGPFTGNLTLIKWFNKLNDHFGVFGQASLFYKPVGKNKTFGVTGKDAKERLQNLLRSNDYSFIYHCYNHYCCPIGFEKESIDKTKIFNTASAVAAADDDNEFESDSTDQSNSKFVDWILIADTSRKYPNFHCVKWEDIDKDLNTKSPEFFNIRNIELGIQTRLKKSSDENNKNQTENNEQNLVNSISQPKNNINSRLEERNLHCIIQFKRVKNDQELLILANDNQIVNLNSNDIESNESEYKKYDDKETELLQEDIDENENYDD